MALNRKVNSPSIYYRFGKSLIRSIYRLLWRLEVHGTSHIPHSGPVIIACNHKSNIDPPLVGVGLHRPVHFLAKKELFSFPPFGWLLKQVNAHPLNRAHGIGALRAAEEVLEQGGVVIVFPEGKRNKTSDLLKPKPGVGMLALRNKVPVIPAYLHNSGQVSKFKKLSVYFGPAVPPDQFQSYEKLAHEVMNRIQKMKDQVDQKI